MKFCCILKWFSFLIVLAQLNLTPTKYEFWVFGRLTTSPLRGPQMSFSQLFSFCTLPCCFSCLIFLFRDMSIRNPPIFVTGIRFCPLFCDDVLPWLLIAVFTRVSSFPPVRMLCPLVSWLSLNSPFWTSPILRFTPLDRFVFSAP